MKLYKNIIIIVIVLVVLAGGLLAVKFLPEKEVENATPNETQKVEYIDVLRVKTDDILKIDLSATNDSYTVSKSGKEYVLSDSANIKISKQAVYSFVNSCSYIYAEKIASENKEDASIYGFSDPAATIVISLKDGSSKTVLIGNETIDASGSYVKVEGEDKIYIKSAYGIGGLMPEYKSFVDMGILEITPDKYNNLSSIHLTKPGSTAIELKSTIVKNEDSEGVLWEMTKPVFAEANTTVLTNDVLTPLESFGASGVAEAKASDLSKYGLDNPYAVLTISADGKAQKFTFGKEENGYRYFLVDNYASVYMTPVSGVSFLDVAYIDLMSRLVHIENIKNVSTVEVKSADQNYVLKISGDERFINDKKIDKDVFTKVYQNIIGLRFDSVDLNKKPTGNSDITFKYTKNDNTTHTVSFESVDDRNYLASVDGRGSSIITKKAVKDALNFIEEKYNEAK